MEMKLWRVKTLKRTDDDDTYVQTSIDHILEDLHTAIEEAYHRLQDPDNLEVSIAREELTDKWKKVYGINY